MIKIKAPSGGSWRRRRLMESALQYNYCLFRNYASSFRHASRATFLPEECFFNSLATSVKDRERKTFSVLLSADNIFYGIAKTFLKSMSHLRSVFFHSLPKARVGAVADVLCDFGQGHIGGIKQMPCHGYTRCRKLLLEGVSRVLLDKTLGLTLG